MRITGMLFITLFMVGCSQSKNSNNLSDPNTDKSQKQIHVTDEYGSAVEGATVVIGDKLGQPFADNLLTTDKSGRVEVSGEWKSPASVTVIKPGYTSVTFLNTPPESLEITLKKLAVAPRLELNGQVTGFENLKKDGFIDFGLVIPSLTVASSLYFDMSSIVSSEVDPITVMGTTLNIPTNVFLPKQTENYSFFSITIEKAFYKLFFLTSGEYLFSATRGKVDFKKLASLMQSGKSFFEAVNEFQFTSTQIHSVNIQEPKQSLNISPNALVLTPKIPFTIPSPDAKKMLFGVSLFSDMSSDNGKLLPADVKLRDSALTQQLSLPTTAVDTRVLLALTQKETVNGKEILSKSLATTLVAPSGLNQAVFLDEIAPPSGDLTGITMKVPTPKGNIKPFATYASLSDVELIPTSGYNLEKKSVLWEVYSDGWIDQAQIPSLVPSFMVQVKRWDVVYYGVPTSEQKVFTGPKSLDNATHAVQNAFDF